MDDYYSMFNGFVSQADIRDLSQRCRELAGETSGELFADLLRLAGVYRETELTWRQYDAMVNLLSAMREIALRCNPADQP